MGKHDGDIYARNPGCAIHPVNGSCFVFPFRRNCDLCEINHALSDTRWKFQSIFRQRDETPPTHTLTPGHPPLPFHSAPTYIEVSFNQWQIA